MFIRRFGKLDVAEESQWDDERIFQNGEGVSLLNNARRRVKEFLDAPKVSSFIYVMVILLCILILVELSIADYINGSSVLKETFRYMNFILLLFFVAEISMRVFSDGMDFLIEPINLFDTGIVISSFIMNILRIEARIVGILRILRLIKVIIEMKRVADEQKERQEMINEQKKRVSIISSNVERVSDLLERLAKNPNVPKALQDDIKWGVKMIASNKLVKNKLVGFKISNDREDAKAWNNLIKLPTSLIVNKQDAGGVNVFDSGIKRADTLVNAPFNKDSKNDLNRKRLTNPLLKNKESVEEVDEFFEIIEETDINIYENILDKFEETQFDSFSFKANIGEKSFQYLMYKIFDIYNLMTPFQISLQKLCNFSGEIQKGYFNENPYHNATHIIDTMQAMHYLYYTANLRKYLKKGDILASFLANIIHDYEHPGFTNQFVIRTKHPLALRYNDQSVLENHHLAASFSVLMKEDNKFLENLSNGSFYELRKIVIKSVLDSDPSRYFHLLTDLKTKLDRNFPTDSQEDINLLISLTLKVSDMFKIVRSLNVFYNWMEQLYEEYYKQGDMEKYLDLPVTKLMDRENTDREKAYANYIEQDCKPLFATFLIIADDDIKKEVIEEGIDTNKVGDKGFKGIKSRF